MGKALRKAVPRLVRLSPALAEVLNEVEGGIRMIDETRLSQWGYFGLKERDLELCSR
jgi:hypothetical protein